MTHESLAECHCLCQWQCTVYCCANQCAMPQCHVATLNDSEAKKLEVELEVSATTRALRVTLQQFGVGIHPLYFMLWRIWLPR